MRLTTNTSVARILPAVLSLWILAGVVEAQTTILSEDFEGAFPAGWSVDEPNATWSNVNSSFGQVGTHGGNGKAFCAGTQPNYTNASADFTGSSITLFNLSGSYNPGIFTNRSDGSAWAITGIGTTAFSIIFVPVYTGLHTLTLAHLSSANSATNCQGGGYSPITITTNGTPLVSCYDPASHHGGVHGFVTDSWTFNATAGVAITNSWSLCGDACSQYWIQQLAITGPMPQYQNSMTAYMQRNIDLTAYTNVTLSFWQIMPSVETGYDYGRVHIDSTEIFRVTNTVSSWSQVSVNLSNYVGGIHTLRFEFVSDNSIWRRGWYLDDILVTATGSLANDKCSGAIAMSEAVTYTVNTTAATSAGDPTPGCQSNFGKGVWYKFTAWVNGKATISTCGSDFHTALQVFQGGCDSLTPVAGGCDDGSVSKCEAGRASVTFDAAAGTNYWILAGGIGGAFGNLRISASQITINANDIPNQVGEYNRAYFTDTTTDVSARIGSSGGPNTWNFSQPINLDEEIRRMDVIVPADSGHASDFPQAAYSEQSTYESDGTRFWTFYSVSQNEGRRYYGEYDALDNPAHPLLQFANPTVDFPTPIYYQDSWTRTVDFTNQIVIQSTLYTTAVHYIAQAQADAYGTIILPVVGAVPALRIMETHTSQFTNALTGGALGTGYGKECYWLVRGVGKAVDILSTESASGPPTSITTALTVLRVFESSYLKDHLLPVNNLRLRAQGVQANLDWSQTNGVLGYRVETSTNVILPEWRLLGLPTVNSWTNFLNRSEQKRFFRVFSRP